MRLFTHCPSIPNGLNSINLFTASIPITSPISFQELKYLLVSFEIQTQGIIKMYFICDLVIIAFCQRFSMCVVKEVSLCLYRMYRPHLPSTNHVNVELCGALHIVTTYRRCMTTQYRAQFGLCKLPEAPQLFHASIRSLRTTFLDQPYIFFKSE